MPEEHKQDGGGDWFAVSRGIFDHVLFQGEEYSRRDAWLWLVAHAAWKAHQVRTRGGMLTLERGEVLVGSEHLAAVFGWSRKRVRNFTAELRREGMLQMGHRPGQYANVAKISSYERFQTPQDGNGPAKRPTKGQRGANEGPYRTKETITANAVRGAREASADANRMVLDQAKADFNIAAKALGFSTLGELTEQRAKALAKRLADLGHGDLTAGGARFREALLAITHWPFLAGREKPRDGRKPFRLDFERLLSTGSGMGDVLAKLCDLHDEHGPAAATTGSQGSKASTDAVADAWREAQAEELAEQQARRHGHLNGGAHDLH